MMLGLVIAPAAQEDLTRIYRRGLVTWGRQQAETYLAHIEEVIWLLTSRPEMGIKRPELAEGLCSFATKRHLVFYRCTKGELQIARVLHGRQDPNRHLANDPT